MPFTVTVPSASSAFSTLSAVSRFSRTLGFTPARLVPRPVTVPSGAACAASKSACRTLWMSCGGCWVLSADDGGATSAASLVGAGRPLAGWAGAACFLVAEEAEKGLLDFMATLEMRWD